MLPRRDPETGRLLLTSKQQAALQRQRRVVLLGLAAILLVAGWAGYFVVSDVDGAGARFVSWREHLGTHLSAQMGKLGRSWNATRTSSSGAIISCATSETTYIYAANITCSSDHDPVDDLTQVEKTQGEIKMKKQDDGTLVPEESRHPCDMDGGTSCLVQRQNEMAALRREFARNLPLRDPEALWRRMNKGKGRGIVMPAGSKTHLANAFSNLKALREVLGCHLPIEIWYLQEEAGEVNTVKPLFEEHVKDVTFISHEHTADPEFFHPHWLTGNPAMGWAFKVFALFSTAFDEVIMLDCDSAPLQDVTRLFDEEAYREAGNLFWPDYPMNSGAPMEHILRTEAYALHHLLAPWVVSPRLTFRQTDSGQFLFHRQRLADVLHWAWFLNSRHQLQYAYQHGDKDTYRLAFELAGRIDQFRQMPDAPGVALNALQEDREGSMSERFDLAREDPAYLYAGMVQYDSAGAVLFNHRTMGSKFDPDSNRYSPTQFLSVKLLQSQEWIVRWIQTIVGDAVVDQNDHWYFWCNKNQVRILGEGLDQAELDRAAEELVANTDLPIPLRRIEAVAGAQAVYDAHYEAFKLFQQTLGEGEPHRVH